MTHHLDVLRSLDAADPADAAPTDTQRDRAAATLERIHRHRPRERHRCSDVRRPAVRPRRGDGGRGLGRLDRVAGQSGGGTAHASWPPTPSAVSDADAAVVGPACRAALEGSSLDLDAARLVLSERRGSTVVRLSRTEDPDISGSCFVQQEPGSSDVGDVGDVDAGAAGSNGPAGLAPSGSSSEGAITQSRGASVTDGGVGEGVTGVTVHAGELSVEATVGHGRHIAWWPGRAFADAPAGPAARAAPLRSSPTT